MAQHYLDPERPRVSGLPAFAPNVKGAGLSIIPGLHCAPRGTPGASMIEVSGFFSRGPNTSSRREILIPASDFPAFWERWLADPEGVAEREFGWTLSPPEPKPLGDLLSANDLLDDFDLPDLL